MINPGESATNEIQTLSQSRSACDEIANAIDGVVGSGHENTMNSVAVSIPRSWNIQIEETPPSLMIKISGENIVNNLKYGFESENLDLGAGTYIVIVQIKSEESISRSRNKITININPCSGGGKWRY